MHERIQRRANHYTKKCPAYDTDTPDTLAARVFEQECIAYPEAIKLFIEEKLQVQNSIVKMKKK